MLRQELFRNRIVSFVICSVITLAIATLFSLHSSIVIAAPLVQVNDAQPLPEDRAPEPLRPDSVESAAPLADIIGSPVGQPISIHSNAGDPPAMNPTIAYNPDRMEYLVVWHNERSVYPDIQAQRISWDGKLVGSSFFVSGGQGAQRRYPDVIYNPTQKQYLVVWENVPDGGRPNIHARFISDQGALLGVEYALGSGPALRSRARPAMAYASVSNKYMVVWASYVQGALSKDIEAVVLDSAGAIEKQFLVQPGDISNSYSEPDIAYNRSRNEYLVVYIWDDKAASKYDIRARLVTRSGELLGSGPLNVGYPGKYGYEPAVAALPTTPGYGKYFVVWRADTAPGDADIYGREVLGDGTLTLFRLIAGTIDTEQQPAIAMSEAKGNYLIGWTNDDHGTPMRDSIRACISDSSGTQTSQLLLSGDWPYARETAIASGPYGTYLSVFSLTNVGSDRNIWGRIWGPTHEVFVTVAQGGAVNSTPYTSTCSSNCTMTFLKESTITLSATVQTGWEFIGWGGACAGTAPSCQLKMNSDKIVTATFQERKYMLTVTKQGQGTVTSNPTGITCGADCAEEYVVGTTVTLTAKPATGWQFNGWGGACTGKSPTCQVTCNVDKIATAQFSREAVYVPSITK